MIFNSNVYQKYQLINNVGGWLVFAIALLTYWLTLEPTASYWDCGEFIIRADKLEVAIRPVTRCLCSPRAFCKFRA